MKKLNLILVLLLSLASYIIAQDTYNLLARAVEELPDQMSVIEQSVQINNLEALNSSELDYSPVMYKDGIIFTSTRKTEQKGWKKLFRKRYADLFVAHQDKTGAFTQPVPLEGKINGKLNEGAATINESGDYMIFTRNSKNGKNGFGNIELKLFSSKLEDGRWTKGRELPLNCEECTTCHPSLSLDGKTLYFASNRAGGFGGMDIYVSEWSDGKWTKPRNLGPEVNSVDDEVFPFINHDGTLYYASDKKGSRGGLDIFLNRRGKLGEFREAFNIGEPFNSSADDFGFSIKKDGLSGLFTSNRLGGKGLDDIYEWRMDQNLEQAMDHSPVRFSVVDDQTGDRLSNSEVTFIEFSGISFDIPDAEAPIAFVSQVNQALIEHLGTTYHYQTDQFGTFLHELKHEVNYMVIVEKPDFKTFRKMSNYNRLSGVKDINIRLVKPAILKQDSVYSDYFEVATVVAPPSIENSGKFTLVTEPASEELKITENIISDESLTATLPAEFTEKGAYSNEKKENYKVGQRIVLHDLKYKTDKVSLKASSKSILDHTVQMLKEHPNMVISVIAHTDSRGSWTLNRWISQKRAEIACNYLISQGIDFKRLTAIGHGEEQLLNDCTDGISCQEQAHQQNNRTEIIINKLKASDLVYVNKE